MGAKAKTTGRYVCPVSFTVSVCGDCGAPFPHRTEEWIAKGQKVPRCELHGARLEPAPRGLEFVVSVAPA